MKEWKLGGFKDDGNVPNSNTMKVRKEEGQSEKGDDGQRSLSRDDC